MTRDDGYDPDLDFAGEQAKFDEQEAAIADSGKTAAELLAEERAKCHHGVGTPCDNPAAPILNSFTVADIDDLQSDYGYGGHRSDMGGAQARTDRQVVAAANELGMKRCEFAEWLCSKLGRWYAEDSGYFHKRSSYRDPVTAAEDRESAKSSMGQMREMIASGSFYG
jgi:hypothetical protein